MRPFHAKPTAGSGTETSEFRREFEQATHVSMRRRLLWYLWIWGGQNVLGGIVTLALLAAGAAGFEVPEGLPKLGSGPATLPIIELVVTQVIMVLGFSAALVAMLRRAVPPRHFIRLSFALLAIDGLEAIAVRASDVAPLAGMFVFALSHLVACAWFTWSPRDAFKAGGIVLAANALSLLLIEPGNWTVTLVQIGVSPLAVLPGIGLTWLRHSRRIEKFGYTFLQRRYGSLRQELAYARAVHESLFPKASVVGPVRFNYRYEPMRQIGGDFLHVATDGPRFSLVILDVTGHGIPAALTVNRLHGEIELLFADNPDIGPGELLRRLNRYVYLTLSRHSLYATALCVRIDAAQGTIEHASGGHPPAFLLGADGSVDELRSTAVVLGACGDDMFDPQPEARQFGTMDTLIAYTDGVTEARNPRGRMLGIEGLRERVRLHAAAPLGDRVSRLLAEVAAHREGLAPDDDTLLVEVYRPAASAVAAPPVEMPASGPAAAVVST